ncbi:MAG: sigma-70 family RNA polymerase sigma factor [Bacteroidaceae bacterium]|jgi:RNA polymerase sigma-70 factor (ECF subfamily)|nr:sigma-70 family RNA polymerase sigma factor [Bacteroidaceae bacterium]
MNNLKMLTDEVLVRLYVEGNNEAFNVLLDRYESKVFTYINYIVRNREVAEDLFQDTFMRVVSTLKGGKYSEQQKFSAWLMRITHNILVDYFRHLKNEKNISNDETEIDLFNDIKLADENNVETQMIQSQNLNGVEKIIKMLPQNQQEIINMRYYLDMSFKEIAALLNCSINTALGRTRYALINLRKLAAEHNVSLAS